jgi:hypothetical protein
MVLKFEFGIWNIWDLGFGEFGIWNLEIGIWNLEIGIWSLGFHLLSVVVVVTQHFRLGRVVHPRCYSHQRFQIGKGGSPPLLLSSKISDWEGL